MNRFCANLLLFLMAVVVFVAGVLRSDGWLPMQDTTLSHIYCGLHIKGLEVLFGKKANAVLISDGSKVLVYTPRKLASVQAILQHHGLC